MAPYLVMFLSSIILLWISERTSSRIVCRLCYIIAVLLPCLLAGMRALTVGTDTSDYPYELYMAANKSGSLIDYYLSPIYHEYKYMPVFTFEIGFTTVYYIATKLFGSFASCLFISEMLTVCPLFLALSKYKKKFKLDIWVGFLIFYFFFYNTTFNAIRQWIAIAFSFYAFSCLIVDKKIMKSFIFILVGTLFHKSGLLGIVLSGLYWLFNIKFKKSIKCGRIVITPNSLRTLLILILSIGIIFGMNYTVVPLMENIGFSRYASYLKGDMHFSINQIILQIPFIFILFFERKYFRKDGVSDVVTLKFRNYLLNIFFLAAVFAQLATINQHSWRTTLIFNTFNMVLFPYIYKGEKNKNRKIIILTIIIVFSVVYWYCNYVLWGRHNTIPYIFS